MARIGQIGIMCRNLEKSVSFYRDILGLQEFTRLGTSDRPIAVLRGGAVDLELIQANPADKPPEVESHTGLNHFALFVRNIDEMVSDLRKKGVKILREPNELYKGIRVAYLEDPDGVRVELLQFSGERVGK